MGLFLFYFTYIILMGLLIVWIWFADYLVFFFLFLIWMGSDFLILHGPTTHGKLLEPKNLFTPSQTKQI